MYSSQGIHFAGSVRGSLKYFTLAGVVLAGLFALPAVAAQSPGWDFEIKSGQKVRTTLTLSNHCSQEHAFRVQTKRMPFFQLDRTGPVAVPPGGNVDIGVTVDAHGLAPRTYKREVVLRCIDCKSEPGCKQEKEKIGLTMRVVKAGATEEENAPEDRSEDSSDMHLRELWYTTQCPAGTRLVTKTFDSRYGPQEFKCCYREATTSEHSCPEGTVAGELGGRACCRISGSDETQSCWDCSKASCPAGSKLDGNICVKSGGCEFPPIFVNWQPADVPLF